VPRSLIVREALDPVTTEAVVTEASSLLDFAAAAQAALAQGRPRVMAIEPSERARLGDLLLKHRDLPMDTAHATLVVLAERLGKARVFTLDRRGFGSYRVGRRKFELLPRG
jgi:predicted nucleic acid-binding protein